MADTWNDLIRRPRDAGEAGLDEQTAKAVLAWRGCGDQRAACWLVRTHRPLVRSIVHRLPSPAQAEDAEQETFIRAFAALDRYDPAQPFAPWLGTIARNVLFNACRAHQRHERLLDRDAAGTALEIPTHGRPDALLATREQLEAVLARLAQLDAGTARVFHLHIFDGLTADAIAATVRTSPGAVRVSVHRARAALRASLAVES